MDEQRKKPGITFWATVLLVALPILYVLSSGPMALIAYETRIYKDGQSVTSLQDWWPMAYRPLVFVAQKTPCGGPLRWYWDLFPPCPR